MTTIPGTGKTIRARHEWYMATSRKLYVCRHCGLQATEEDMPTANKIACSWPDVERIVSQTLTKKMLYETLSVGLLVQIYRQLSGPLAEELDPEIRAAIEGEMKFIQSIGLTKTQNWLNLIAEE